MNARREHLLGDIVGGVLATASFGSSLRHVQTVAASHGQHGLISWAIAISVELVALVAILELRRSRGHDGMPAAAVVALAAGLIMSAGANLATATGAGFGWSQVVAVWPAVAYVLVAVIIETRPDAAAAAAPIDEPVVDAEPVVSPPAEPKESDEEPRRVVDMRRHFSRVRVRHTRHCTESTCRLGVSTHPMSTPSRASATGPRKPQ